MGLVAPFFHPDLKPQHRSKLVTQIKLDQVQTPKPLQQFWNKLPSTRCHILPQYDSFMTGFMTHFTINSTLPKKDPRCWLSVLRHYVHDPLSPTNQRRNDFRFKIFQASGVFAKEILRAKHDTCRGKIGKTPREVPKLTRHQRSPMVRSGPLKHNTNQHNVESMRMMPPVSIKCQTDSDLPSKMHWTFRMPGRTTETV